VVWAACISHSGHNLNYRQAAMSTSEPAMVGDGSHSEDRTHPAADILNALSTLNSPIKTEVPQLPPGEYDLLNAQLADNPHNPEAWRRLIDVAEASGDIEKISATYDALLKQYPNTVCLPPLTPFTFSSAQTVGSGAN